MNDERLKQIKERLEAARPKYGFITAMLGSGDHLCTAIVAEDSQTGNKDFIADLFPDYVMNNLGDGNSEYLDIRFEGHHARMKFFKSVFDDMDYLLDLLDTIPQTD
jgi:hypothetical protein